MSAKNYYQGLTWDHPRGVCALRAAADLRHDLDGVVIEWHKQPLEGFESVPLADLCARYDLVVMDHPHLGEAYDAGCLVALEDIFSDVMLAKIKSAAVGSSAMSYFLHDHHWALPLDAATQVCAYRADLLSTPPVTWEDVLQLARQSGKVVLSLAGPHALLSFMSICVALDEKSIQSEKGIFIKSEIGAYAYQMMQQLVAHAPTHVEHCNPIGILDHMAHVDDVVLCPLIYGYVNYASPAAGANLVSFTNAPCMAEGRKIGTVLGGTGIAISKKCHMSDGLKRHLLWLMSDEAQIEFIPRHQGQPANLAAWKNEYVNQQVNNFYRNTLSSLEDAFIRPRHNGYISFQTQASQLLRAGLKIKKKADELVEDLNYLFQHSIL